MAGANVLLGEMVRAGLPGLAKEHTLKLPGFDPGFRLEKDDPLHSAEKEEDRDDPAAQYQNGILARDGGHFTALFPDAENAEKFKTAAEEKLIQELPGLRFEIHCKPFEEKREKERAERAKSRLLVELPQFQVCEESGNGPAAGQINSSKENKSWASSATQRRWERGRQFYDGLKGRSKPTRDMAGLLSPDFPLADCEEPRDLEALCGGDYMAVLHADGNSIGRRRNDWCKSHTPESPPHNQEEPWKKKLLDEARGEQFFYSMRVTVRRAIKKALEKTYTENNYKAYAGVRPYQILMLGGDDLLMVCRAKDVFTFLTAYADVLASRDYLLADEKALTVGAGVVIATHNLPFHHLHHLAETLAGSAKRLFRGQPENARTSVADWLVSTNSWVDDPLEMRVRDSLASYPFKEKTENLVLTGRPYPILSAGSDCPDSLEKLWEGARKLRTLIDKKEGKKAARSQLRNLLEQLPKGRRRALLAFQDMPPETRDALKEVGLSELWPQHKIVEREGEIYYQTPFADLVELYEISNLGDGKNA
ncbi:MAG: hypothetical protein GY862_15050 [Gammaproteobacteria bacterium]|nr:hypothetical protein [Gammaproteobacteria bacterium]